MIVREHLEECRACFRRATGLLARDNFDELWDSWTAEAHGLALRSHAELVQSRDREAALVGDAWADSGSAEARERTEERVDERVDDRVDELEPVAASGAPAGPEDGDGAGPAAERLSGPGPDAEPGEISPGPGDRDLGDLAGIEAVAAAATVVTVVVDREKRLAFAAVAQFPGKYELRLRPGPGAPGDRRALARVERRMGRLAAELGPSLRRGGFGRAGGRARPAGAMRLLRELAEAGAGWPASVALEVYPAGGPPGEGVESATDFVYTTMLGDAGATSAASDVGGAGGGGRAGRGAAALEVAVDGASGRVAVGTRPGGASAWGFGEPGRTVALLVPAEDPEAVRQAPLGPVEGRGPLLAEFEDVPSGVFSLSIVPLSRR